MAKVFNGDQFLKDHSVKLVLSNGKEFTINEIMPATMDKVAAMEQEEGNSATVRKILTEVCSAPAGSFDDIGLIEARGAIDFLLENLFDQKPQS